MGNTPRYPTAHELSGTLDGVYKSAEVVTNVVEDALAKLSEDLSPEAVGGIKHIYAEVLKALERKWAVYAKLIEMGDADREAYMAENDAFITSMETDGQENIQQ